MRRCRQVDSHELVGGVVEQGRVTGHVNRQVLVGGVIQEGVRRRAACSGQFPFSPVELPVHAGLFQAPQRGLVAGHWPGHTLQPLGWPSLFLFTGLFC